MDSIWEPMGEDWRSRIFILGILRLGIRDEIYDEIIYYIYSKPPKKKLKSSVAHSEIKLESLNEEWIFHILGHHRDLVQRQVRHIFQDEDPAATRGGVGFDDPKSTLLVVHLQKLLKGEPRVKSLKSGKSTQVCILYLSSVICVHLCSSVFICVHLCSSSSLCLTSWYRSMQSSWQSSIYIQVAKSIKQVFPLSPLSICPELALATRRSGAQNRRLQTQRSPPCRGSSSTNDPSGWAPWSQENGSLAGTRSSHGRPCLVGSALTTGPTSPFHWWLSCHCWAVCPEPRGRQCARYETKASRYSWFDSHDSHHESQLFLPCLCSWSYRQAVWSTSHWAPPNHRPIVSPLPANSLWLGPQSSPRSPDDHFPHPTHSLAHEPKDPAPVAASTPGLLTGHGHAAMAQMAPGRVKEEDMRQTPDRVPGGWASFFVFIDVSMYFILAWSLLCVCVWQCILSSTSWNCKDSRCRVLNLGPVFFLQPHESMEQEQVETLARCCTPWIAGVYVSTSVNH